jgi:hypothetical protein
LPRQQLVDEVAASGKAAFGELSLAEHINEPDRSADSSEKQQAHLIQRNSELHG